MKKQTAVEWLNAEIEKSSNPNIIGLNLNWNVFDELIKQAKEMEKNQIIQAVNEHDEKCVKTCNGVVKRLKPSIGSLFDYSGEEGVKYYNEKFENGKN